MNSQDEFYQKISESDFKSALELGKKLLENISQDVPSHLAEANLSLAHLYCHLGEFSASIPHYHTAYEYFEKAGETINALNTCQNLAAALIEKGEYEAAIQLLEGKGRSHLSETQVMEQTVHSMHLALAFIGIGSFPEAQQVLEKIKAQINQDSFQQLAPYHQLLQGRSLLIQGKYTEAFPILKEAGNRFSEMGDLAGEIEVLLALTAPLLEYQLFQEAQQLIDQISTREELKQFPALEHSMHLRRLALGAFLGKWVPSDLELLQTGGMKHGRTEDWLQFWFHLSLAATRIGENHLSQLFLQRAKEIAHQIESQLTPQHATFFHRRPDIARLFRLSEREAEKKREAIQSSETIQEGSAAEAGTLAPPTLKKS